MTWVAVDKNGYEFIYRDKPCLRFDTYWYAGDEHFVELPKGSIKKLIGRKLTWEDEPVKLKQKNNYG